MDWRTATSEANGSGGSPDPCRMSDEMIFTGSALTADAVTTGLSGITKRWPEITLKEAAETLDGQPVYDRRYTKVQSHAESIVGEVTSAWYEDGEVRYEVELHDDQIDLVEALEEDMFDLAPAMHHSPTPPNDDVDVQAPTDIQFKCLYPAMDTLDGVPGIDRKV